MWFAGSGYPEGRRGAGTPTVDRKGIVSNSGVSGTGISGNERSVRFQDEEQSTGGCLTCQIRYRTWLSISLFAVSLLSHCCLIVVSLRVHMNKRNLRYNNLFHSWKDGTVIGPDNFVTPIMFCNSGGGGCNSSNFRNWNYFKQLISTHQ